MVDNPYPRKLSLLIDVYFKICKNPEVYFKLEGGISSLWGSRVVKRSEKDFYASVPAACLYQLLLHIPVVVRWLAGRVQINKLLKREMHQRP